MPVNDDVMVTWFDNETSSTFVKVVRRHQQRGFIILSVGHAVAVVVDAAGAEFGAN